MLSSLYDPSKGRTEKLEYWNGSLQCCSQPSLSPLAGAFLCVWRKAAVCLSPPPNSVSCSKEYADGRNARCTNYIFLGWRCWENYKQLYFFFFLFMKCLLNYFFWLKCSPPLKLEIFASGIFPPRPFGLFPIIVLASFLKGCLVCPNRGLCSLSFWIHCLVWIEVYYNKICCLFFFLKNLLTSYLSPPGSR